MQFDDAREGESMAIVLTPSGDGFTVALHLPKVQDPMLGTLSFLTGDINLFSPCTFGNIRVNGEGRTGPDGASGSAAAAELLLPDRLQLKPDPTSEVLTMSGVGTSDQPRITGVLHRTAHTGVYRATWSVHMPTKWTAKHPGHGELRFAGEGLVRLGDDGRMGLTLISLAQKALMVLEAEEEK
jgi:hypothetical protein